jgi:hypothetical protein
LGEAIPFPPLGGDQEGLLKKKAHRDSMSRFLLMMHSGASLHGNCKKLLRHHQFVFLNNFISILFRILFQQLYAPFCFSIKNKKTCPFRGAGPF